MLFVLLMTVLGNNRKHEIITQYFRILVLKICLSTIETIPPKTNFIPPKQEKL